MLKTEQMYKDPNLGGESEDLDGDTNEFGYSDEYWN